MSVRVIEPLIALIFWPRPLLRLTTVTGAEDP
jgi:hypothetical protein